jgi:hypothetical protein
MHMRCRLPLQADETADVLTGGPEYVFAFHRREFGVCGRQGRFWQPRPPSIWVRLFAALFGAKTKR